MSLTARRQRPQAPLTSHGAFALICAAVMTLACVLAVEPRVSPAGQDPDRDAPRSAQSSPSRSWWFPSDINTETEHRFHISVHAVITEEGRTRRDDAETDFSVHIVSPPGDRPSLVVRLVPPPLKADDHASSLLELWLSGWAAGNPDGIMVTSKDLLVGGAPLLRGRWHAGERFTIGGFGFLWMPLFGVAQRTMGFVHVDVDAIGATTADLKFEFWMGRSGPALRGTGTLSFNRDAKGMTSVHATWTRTYGNEKRDVKIAVSRTSVRKLSAAPVDP